MNENNKNKNRKEAREKIHNEGETPWRESASELYRPSDRRLSAKLVLTFTDREVSRGQHGGSLRL
jgi:hypothetical protein